MNITLRMATEDDAKNLFDWRNDAETVAQSTGKPVEWESHVKWLTNVLKQQNRILCIAEKDGTAVGTVRADLAENDDAEISFTVAPSSRGQGISKPMVAQFVKKYLAGKKIVANIPKGHVASESVARALGLKPFLGKAPRSPHDPRPMVEWR